MQLITAVTKGTVPTAGLVLGWGDTRVLAPGKGKKAQRSIIPGVLKATTRHGTSYSPLLIFH